MTGSDYRARSGTIRFAAGDTTPKIFSIPIIKDARVEPEETVHLTLSNPMEGATLGTPHRATLTILKHKLCAGLKATLVGTPGKDFLIGTDGPDIIYGRGGNDIIYGRRGNDVICGGAGDDTIYGGHGSDRLSGGRGNDILMSGKGVMC